jgi:hypothetical protein
MTSTFNISLSAKTAHRVRAGFGAQAGCVGGPVPAGWTAAPAMRTANVDADPILDVLAARGAG